MPHCAKVARKAESTICRSIRCRCCFHITKCQRVARSDRRIIWMCNTSRSRHAEPSTSSATSPTICNGFPWTGCQQIPTTRCANSRPPVRNAFEETLSSFGLREAVDKQPKCRAMIGLHKVCELVHEDILDDPPGHPLQAVRQPDALLARAARAPTAVLIGHPTHRTWFGQASKISAVHGVCQREKSVIARLAAQFLAIEAIEERGNVPFFLGLRQVRRHQDDRLV